MDYISSYAPGISEVAGLPALHEVEGCAEPLGGGRERSVGNENPDRAARADGRPGGPPPRSPSTEGWSVDGRRDRYTPLRLSMVHIAAPPTRPNRANPRPAQIGEWVEARTAACPRRRSGISSGSETLGRAFGGQLAVDVLRFALAGWSRCPKSLPWHRPCHHGESGSAGRCSGRSELSSFCSCR